MAEFSPTRTHATWKPRVTAAHIPFYRCNTCGTIFAGIDSPVETHTVDDGERSLRVELPYSSIEINPSCCGEPMEKLEPIPWEDVQNQFKFDYRILGGFNNNCVEIKWDGGLSGLKPKWIALKTFTGLQLKYVTPKKWPPLVFAFADEDAFAYCDKNPCQECTFRCKSGMEIYCYVEGLGLLVRSMDRMVNAGNR